MNLCQNTPQIIQLFGQFLQWIPAGRLYVCAPAAVLFGVKESGRKKWQVKTANKERYQLSILTALGDKEEETDLSTAKKEHIC